MLFKHEVLASLDSPLPVQEEALSLHLQHTKARARQELSRVYCASSEPWKEVSDLAVRHLSASYTLSQAGPLLWGAVLSVVRVCSSRFWVRDSGFRILHLCFETWALGLVV